MPVKRAKGTRATERTTRRDTRASAQPRAKVAVTFRHVDPTVAIRQYAERKLTPLAKLLKRPCEIHLILSVDKYRQHGEVTFKSGAFGLTAQEETKDLYSVIDLLADKVARQVKSHQGKAASRRLRAPSAGEVLSAESDL
jgi:putative sigma-54 modulation protein